MQIFLLVIMLMLPALSHAGGRKQLLCTQREAKVVIPIAERHSSFDKNRHCTVSCMLALKCNYREVLLAGLLKEFEDVFGPGNAEIEDFIADRHGVSLVRHQRARTHQECLDQCDLRYR